MARAHAVSAEGAAARILWAENREPAYGVERVALSTHGRPHRRGDRQHQAGCLVDHVGAKSGTKRTTPLVYTRDGDDVIIVGSQGGAPKTPSWVFNLRANPRTTIQIGSKKWAVVAREASDEERERLWPMVVDTYADFAVYQARTERKLPVVILTPAGIGSRA